MSIDEGDVTDEDEGSESEKKKNNKKARNVNNDVKEINTLGFILYLASG